MRYRNTVIIAKKSIIKALNYEVFIKLALSGDIT